MQYQLHHCAPGARRCMAIMALAAATLASGCAATSTPSHVAGPTVPAAGEPSASPGAVARPARVATEGDEFPVPFALRNRAIGSDDPREPWSPSYGAAKVKISALPQSPDTTKQFVMAEPAPVLKVIPRPIDPDDVIRQAIAAHEMRQR